MYRIYAMFTLHIYIFFLFLASCVNPKVYISISLVSYSLFTCKFTWCLHDDYSFRSMQHSLVNNSLKHYWYTPIWRWSINSKSGYFIKTKYTIENPTLDRDKRKKFRESLKKKKSISEIIKNILWKTLKTYIHLQYIHICV